MEQQLTKREELIERILHMSNAEVTEVFELIEALHKSTADGTRADEEMWDRQFAESQDQLAKLADEALDEYRAGKTRPFNPQ